MDLTKDDYFGPPHPRAIPTGGNEFYVPGDPHGSVWPADGSVVFIREDDHAELHEPPYKMEVDPLAEDEDKNILCELVGRMKPEKQFSTYQCVGVKKEEYGDGFKALVKEEFAKSQLPGGAGEAYFLPPHEQLHQYEQKPSVKEETDVKLTYGGGDQSGGFADGSKYHHANLQTMEINQVYMNSRDVLQKPHKNEKKPSDNVKEERDDTVMYSDDDRDVDFGNISDNENENQQNTDVDKTDLTSQHLSQKFIASQHEKPVNQAELDQLELEGSSQKATSKKIFKCGECDKTYYEEQKYEDHINVHYNIRSYICNICEAGFFYQRNLDRHLENRHGKNLDKSKHNKEAKHVMKKHDKRNRYNKAVVARIKTSYKSYSKCTSTSSTDIKMTSSCTVEKVNHLPTRLRTNKKAILSQNEEFEYQCYECNKTYDDKKKFEDHIDTHFTLADYLCEMCEKSFSSNRFLNEHIKHVHNETHALGAKSLVFDHNLRSHVPSTTWETVNSVKPSRTQSSHKFSLRSASNTPPANNTKSKGDSEQVNQRPVRSTTTKKATVLQNDESTLEYQCYECNKTFDVKKKFEDHIDIHLRVVEHVCEKCERSFSSIRNLNEHLKHIHHETPYNCALGTESLICKDNGRLHVSNEHVETVKTMEPTENNVNQSIDFQKTIHHNSTISTNNTSKQNLVFHSSEKQGTAVNNEESTPENTQVKEIGCQKKVDEVSHLPKGNSNKMSTLENFNGHFDEEQDFEYHDEAHSQVTEDACDESEGTEENPETVDLPNEEVYRCEMCGKIYCKKHELEDHMNEHKSACSQSHHCTSCSETFISLSALKSHISNKHGTSAFKKAILPLQSCEFCHQSFTKKNLQRHIQHKHLGQNQEYICSYCSASFPIKYSLTRHILKKHLTPTVQCTQCGEMFQKHRLDNRQGDICEYCAKAFKLVSSLSKETSNKMSPLDKLHGSFNEVQDCEYNSKAQPQVIEYDCDVCRESFASTEYLQSHKIKVHSDRNYSCMEGTNSQPLRLNPISQISQELKTSLNASQSTVENPDVVDPPLEEVYTCEICGKIYCKKGELEDHMNEHALGDLNSQFHHCSSCSETFTSISALNSHISDVHQTFPPLKVMPLQSCEFCHQSFPKQNLQRHIQRKHLNLEYVCDHCSAVFTTKYCLTRHMLRRHLFLTVKCTQCSEMFQKRRFDVQKRRQADVCKNCVKTFKIITGQKSQSLNDSDKRKFCCEICGKLFSFLYSYKRHLKIHRKLESLNVQASKYKRNENIRLKVCEICAKCFSSGHSLKVHIQAKHSIEGSQIHCCDSCSKTFLSKSGLRNHFNRKHCTQHNPPIKVMVRCEYCNKMFSDTKSKLRHVELKHSFSREFICDHCSKTFPIKEKLLFHITKEHLPPMYKCRECSEMFHGSVERATHLRKKHGIDKRKLFHPCDQCGKVFKQRWTLDIHMSIHTNELPFCCETCGKQFRTESNLLQHSKVHLDVRKFSCDLCSKSFKIKHHLRQHMAVHGLESIPKYGKRGRNRSV